MSDLAQLEAVLTETHQPAVPLTHVQMSAYLDEARRLGGIVEQRDADGRPNQNWIGGDISQARRRLRQINTILTDQAPKKLGGGHVNTVYDLASQVIKDTIIPAMLPRAAMRRNPAGAVGAFQRQEGSRPYKRAVLAVRRAIRAVDPDNPDPDLTNMERFRGEGSPDGTASFKANATIPGYHAMTPLAKARWPEGLAEPQNTALKQVQRAATATGHRKTKKTPREKRPASPAQLAALQRAHAALQAKRAAAQDLVPGTPLAAAGD